MLNDTSSAMAFLSTRRSTPAKTLTLPVPGKDALREIITAAARSPDHGKLQPWRFIVLERAAMLRLAEDVKRYGEAQAIDPDKIQKMQDQFSRAHLAVAVVGVPKPTEKIPALEQTLSAGAVCLALLNAAIASGWGANWLSGWASHDPEFTQAHLGLEAGEFIAGLIHIGTASQIAPERPRPNIDEITSWIAE